MDLPRPLQIAFLCYCFPSQHRRAVAAVVISHINFTARGIAFVYIGSWGHINAMSCFVMKEVGRGMEGLQDTSWSFCGAAEDVNVSRLVITVVSIVN